MRRWGVTLGRAGLLRHYDSLVSEIGALHDALDRLRKAAASDPEEKAAIDRLAALVDRQEELVEQFKSKNALLQNSLAYFGLFSARLATSDRSGPLVAAASTLAAAMLHLTLNTSPTTALAVEERLDEFATLRLPPGDAEVGPSLAGAWPNAARPSPHHRCRAEVLVRRGDRQ